MVLRGIQTQGGVMNLRVWGGKFRGVTWGGRVNGSTLMHWQCEATREEMRERERIGRKGQIDPRAENWIAVNCVQNDKVVLPSKDMVTLKESDTAVIVGSGPTALAVHGASDLATADWYALNGAAKAIGRHDRLKAMVCLEACAYEDWVVPGVPAIAALTTSHAVVLEVLESAPVYGWWTPDVRGLEEKHTLEKYWDVCMALHIAPAALHLLHMMGYRKVHIFGCDYSGVVTKSTFITEGPHAGGYSTDMCFRADGATGGLDTSAHKWTFVDAPSGVRVAMSDYFASMLDCMRAACMIARDCGMTVVDRGCGFLN